MKRSKQRRCALLAVVLATAMTVPVGAVEGVTTGSIIGQTVLVDMKGRTGDVALANNSVTSAASVSDLVSGSMAAINGGFFNAYCKGGIVFPTNFPEIYGAIVKDSEIINGAGANNSIGFTYDGQVLIDRVNLNTTIKIGNKDSVTAWGVNKQYDDSRSIVLLTSHMRLPVTVPEGGKVFTIRDNKIVAEAGAGTYNVPDNAKLLIYNKDALGDVSQWGHAPAVGDTAIVEYHYSPTRKEDLEAWENVQTVVSGGRMLVQNGYNVSASDTYNESITAADQSNSSVAQRSYAALMSDGRLALGTANSSFSQIATSLVAQGAVNAVSLDGGASSMLYANGSFLHSAGRPLASVLTIVPQKPKPARLEKPDSWAIAAVEECKALALIPEALQCKYKEPITREEFCDTLACLIPVCSGKSMADLCTQQGVSMDDVYFSDAAKNSIRSCAALGIVTGYPDQFFGPKKSISRQEAAVMLQRTAELLGVSIPSAGKTFADQNLIRSWAVEAVDFVTSCGIMNGTGTGFSPTDTYTRQQAFQTMLNTYRVVTQK